MALRAIMDWKRRRTWRKVVHTSLTECGGSDYVQLLRASAESVGNTDSSTAVFDALASRADHASIVAAMEHSLSARVSHVMAYHACRTADVSSYYAHGLRLPDPAASQEAFRAMCVPLEVGEAEAERAIRSVGLPPCEQRVFLALDPRDFLEYSGHYLIDGSEYTQALFAAVAGEREAEWRPFLRRRGRATILRCAIPMSWVKDRRDLAEDIILDHARWVIKGHGSPCGLDHTLALRQAVPPEMVVGCCHPTRIPDPHAGYRIWNDVRRAYE